MRSKGVGLEAGSWSPRARYGVMLFCLHGYHVLAFGLLRFLQHLIKDSFGWAVYGVMDLR